MKKNKLFDLIERSFIDLHKTNKKIWIILITYYLYHSVYESIFDVKLDRASFIKRIFK